MRDLLDRINRHEAPPNEQSTCDWVIKPILRKLGYEDSEMLAQERGPGRDIPDFRILHREPCDWYLEAKRWGAPLTQEFAYQCVSYAAPRGKKWVVLTSGDHWQIYDLRLDGQATEKLAAEAAIADVDALEGLLQALAPDSVRTGATIEYLDAQLLRRDQERKVRELDAKVASDVFSLDGPGLTMLKSHFQEAGHSWAESPDLLAALLRTAVSRQNIGSQPILPAEPRSVIDTVSQPVREVSIGSDHTFARPVAVKMPDATAITATQWKDVAVAVVAWVHARGRMPRLPFVPGRTTSRPFVAASDSGMTEPRRIAERVQIFVETHASANDLMRKTAQFISTAGYRVEDFTLTQRS